MSSNSHAVGPGFTKQRVLEGVTNDGERFFVDAAGGEIVIAFSKTKYTITLSGLVGAVVDQRKAEGSSLKQQEETL